MGFKKYLAERRVKVQDGDYVNIGDEVGFKDGHEQYGTYEGMKGSNMKLSVWDSDAGENVTVFKHPSDVWSEE